MAYIYLSHILDETTPAYGNGPSLVRKPEKRMDKGDSCNSEFWQLPNHIGTHVDAPRHFSPKGTFLDAYPANFWNCRPAWCIEVEGVLPGQILTLSDRALDRIPEGIELLLIKTGFARGQVTYMTQGPGVDPGLADQLRNRFPGLKMIGLDFISLSSFTARDLGRKAHQAFLDHDRPILIIEDMDLAEIQGGSLLEQVLVCPLRVRNSDAAPCTVLANLSSGEPSL